MADGKPVGHLESVYVVRKIIEPTLRLVTGIPVKVWTALAFSFPPPRSGWQE